MGVFLGRALFSATLLFFFFGLIFCVVGYFGKWLVPRFGYRPSVLYIGVSKACFEGFEKLASVVANLRSLSGCHDTTKTSQVFAEAPRENVSPGWF